MPRPLNMPNDVDWPLVNRAIMKRWSPSGLLYIKRQAWKRVGA